MTTLWIAIAFCVGMVIGAGGLATYASRKTKV